MKLHVLSVLLPSPAVTAAAVWVPAGKSESSDFLLMKLHVLSVLLPSPAVTAAAVWVPAGKSESSDFLLMKLHVLSVLLSSPAAAVVAVAAAVLLSFPFTYPIDNRSLW